jgi:hypothetical protein
MRLGTFWLVRVGIVVLLTSLVFFGNLAYHTYISKLGPPGKIGLLYFASGLLLGFGAWWQRKAAKEALQNYAQVLFAGGLAAVYFTTYAAHHIDRLRIIASPTLDGSLLLIWAGFIVWIADRKKSQVLALFAVLLAWYSSVITTVGLFTLYSNLVLTIAAVFFLVRNRWATLSFVSLGATYAAYGYWRFCNGQEWHWALPGTNLWTGAQFLIAYWVVFTAAVFLSKDAAFKGQNRASLLTSNNGAFFILFLLTMFKVHHHKFWQFGIIYGTALLGLAGLAKWVLADERITRDSYLTQGLMLATVGIISHPDLAGLNLALILATESVILLATGQMRKNLILLIGGYVTSTLAVGWGVDGLQLHDPHGLWLGAGLGGLMTVNALLAHRHLLTARQPNEEHAPPKDSTIWSLRPQPSFFTVLSLVAWLAVTWNNAAREDFTLILSAEAGVLILSIYALRVPEISLFGLAYLCLGQAVWSYDVFLGTLSMPWWNPILMLTLNLFIAQWWQRQKTLKLAPDSDFAFPSPRNIALAGKSLVLLAATALAVRYAGGWHLETVIVNTTLGIWLPIILGAMILFDGMLHHWQQPPEIPAKMRLLPSYATILALLVWLGVTWHHVPREIFPVSLAIEGCVLVLSIYLLRVPEVTVLSQLYLAFAQGVWAYEVFMHQTQSPWWSLPVMIAVNIGIAHWWRSQKVLRLAASEAFDWAEIEQLATLGKGLVLATATCQAVRFAGGWQLEHSTTNPLVGFWLPVSVGGLTLLDAWLHHKREPGCARDALRLWPSFSTSLALVVWLGVTWHHTAIQNFPLVLALEAVALTLSIYALKMPEISLLGQAYLLIAQFAWVSHFGFDHGTLPAWWNPILLIAISLGTSHWWQKQRATSLDRRVNLVWQGAYSLAIVGVLYFWLSAQIQAPTWLMLTAALGIVFTAYGAFTRSWLLAAAGQIFIGVSVFQFALQIGNRKPAWYFPIATLAALAFLSWSAVHWLSDRPQVQQRVREPVLGLAMIYRWLALLLSLCWVAKYVPDREFVWVYLTLGFVLFLLGGWRKLPEAFLWSATYSIAGLGCFWFPPHESSIVYFPNLLALLLLLVEQQLAKRHSARAPFPAQAQAAAIVAGGLSLWFLLTRWVIEIAERHQERYGLLTASWSVFALLLFLCGMPLRERLYRWMGLAVLACSLGRAALFDVWKLEAVYRVLSFAALGVVLLVLGFLYTKYQEKIKEWL